MSLFNAYKGAWRKEGGACFNKSGRSLLDRLRLESVHDVDDEDGVVAQRRPTIAQITVMDYCKWDALVTVLSDINCLSDSCFT